MRRALVVGALLWLVGCGSSGDEAEDREEKSTSQREKSQKSQKSEDEADPPEDQERAEAEPDKKAAKPDANQAREAPPSAAETQPELKGVAPPEGFKAKAMNECDLHTKWPGDEYCILPPPPDKGFQLHIGPSDYDNPDPMYLLEAGQENVRRYENESANDKDIKFYVRQYRMRPGAHHTIVRDKSTGRRLSGSDVNQDHPIDGIIAPENAGVGIPLAAHSPLSTDHHAINVTDKTILQEVWVNFWYVDPEKVTETTTLLYDPGSVSTTVAPHEDVVLGPYDCDIQAQGRLINMFGHVHANNVRFSAWRQRGDQRDLIYESYHWEDPLWLEFTSLAKNTPADPMKALDGGWTGMVDLQPGDKLSWECHEVNQQDSTLKFTNQTFKGWMCIIIGELVGTSCKGHLRVPVDPSVE